MKIGSLFDGSGGFPLAATMCGGTPVWASEIEPYPIAVTKSRFPNMKHLGSVTQVKGNKVEPVDVITFGSPCQDLSVAGKGAGLKHTENGDEETTRSGLFMEAVRIIKEMRESTNGIYPRFALWENVPGAFSINKGEDFRTVCEEIIKIVEPDAIMPAVPKNGWAYADSYSGDGWSIAYRVFDAQYWGVPQRRRRIYLVADFRGACAGKILFERKGLRGYFETGRTPWQRTTADAQNCSSADDREAGEGTPSIDRSLDAVGFDTYNMTPTRNKTVTLRADSEYNYAPIFMPIIDKNILDDQGGSQISVRKDGKCPTLRAEMHGNIPSVIEPIPIHDQATRFSGKRGDSFDGKGNGLGVGTSGDPMNTLTSGDRHVAAFQTYQRVTGPLMANTHPGSYTGQDAYSNMLVARKETTVVFDKEVYQSGQNATGGHYISESGPAPTLRSTGHPPGVCTRYIVRRLTPTECARLQGFADTWAVPDKKGDFTDEEYHFWLTVRNTHAEINEKVVKEYTKAQMLNWYNKLHTDSSEYKLWGNGIALPTALYVMQGIADVLNQ